MDNFDNQVPTVERLVLGNALHDPDYAAVAWQYLKKEFFEERPEQIVYAIMDDHYKTYREMPSQQSLEFELPNNSKLTDSLSEHDYQRTEHLIRSLRKSDESPGWLKDKSKEWIAKRRQYKAMSKMIGTVSCR